MGQGRRPARDPLGLGLDAEGIEHPIELPFGLTDDTGAGPLPC